MTREEIIAQVKPEVARQLGAYLRSSIPVGLRTGDATVLISNEGMMTGWLKAAELIESLANPKPEEQKPAALYSESQPR